LSDDGPPPPPHPLGVPGSPKGCSPFDDDPFSPFDHDPFDASSSSLSDEKDDTDDPLHEPFCLNFIRNPFLEGRLLLEALDSPEDGSAPLLLLLLFLELDIDLSLLPAFLPPQRHLSVAVVALDDSDVEKGSSNSWSDLRDVVGPHPPSLEASGPVMALSEKVKERERRVLMSPGLLDVDAVDEDVAV